MTTHSQTITDTSPAAPGDNTASFKVFSGLSKFQSGLIVATLQGGTGGTLDVYLQVLDPDSGDWIDYLHFAQKTAGAIATTVVVPITRDYQRVASLAIGKNAAPALAADTCVGGEFGDTMRLIFVTGAGTSAGAVQVVRFIGTLPN